MVSSSDRECRPMNILQTAVQFLFYAPVDVHVNCQSISGEVATVNTEGKYLVAWHPKSSTENNGIVLYIGKTERIIL